MSDKENTIKIRVLIDIPESSLATIVNTAKQIVKPDEKGVFHVDTADVVGDLISDFLAQRDFEDFVSRPSNYRIFQGKRS